MTTPSHAELLREYLEQLSQPGAESRLPVWKDWFRLRVGGAMAIGAALTLAACDSDTDPQGNQGGTAGMTQAAGTGGTSNTTDPIALYAAPMGGDTSTGGVTAGVRYAVPLGGNQGTGGQTAARGGSSASTALGGFTAVALYAIVMEPSGGTGSG
jgi:hypothetical protein